MVKTGTAWFSAVSGTITTLLTPAEYKKMTSNENGFIHGAMLLCSPSSRRKDKKEMSLSFFLYSDSQEDLKRDLDKLEELLVNGNEENGVYNGVNEMSLPEYGICLRLVFEKVAKVDPWIPHNCAIITLKFIEPNPNNRSMPKKENV